MWRFLATINQSFFPPIISSLLFLAIFHFVLGRSQDSSFLEFLVPGLVMMAIINSAFSNTSFSIFLAKWTHYFQMILTTPLSYLELVLAYNIGSIVRGIITAAGIYVAIMIFVPIGIFNLGIMLLYFLLASIIFASLGIFLALWADHFEHLGIFTTFFLTPLTMLGGVFYSIDMLPEKWQFLTLWNPVFYLVDGFRYGTLGIHDAPIGIGLGVSTALAIISFATVTILMKKGWRVKQ